MIYTNAHLSGWDSPTDITVERGVITHIGRADAAGKVVDLDGRFVTPGLWDAHVHFDTHALTSTMIDVSKAGNAQDLGRALLPFLEREIVIAKGSWAGTWERPLTLLEMDALSLSPVVVIGNDLHSAWLNSAALRLFGLPGGVAQLGENDAFDMQRRLHDMIAHDEPVHNAASAAAARGVVGIVDFEMTPSLERWERRMQGGFNTLKVECATSYEYRDMLRSAGLRSGDQRHPLLRVGPLKIISDGSLGSKTAWMWQPYAHDQSCFGAPNISQTTLLEVLADAAANHWDVAVHAIGDHAVSAAIDAFAQTGARGSIEHAQTISPLDISRMADLGLRASMQPAHMIDDHAIAGSLLPHAMHSMFQVADFFDAGISVSFGSDAPVSKLDPWVSIAAATTRATPVGVWDADQAITLEQAIACSTRSIIAQGQPADLIALGGDPTHDLATMPVDLTLVAGHVTHSSL